MCNIFDKNPEYITLIAFNRSETGAINVLLCYFVNVKIRKMKYLK